MELMKKNKKAPFFVFADKLLKNLRIMNEVDKCQNCNKKIDKNINICPHCGSIIENKKTYEENLDYIRAYINDVSYTQNEIIHELELYIKRLVKTIGNLKLKLGYEICPICFGKGSRTIITSYPLDMFAFNPVSKTTQYCENCNGEGVIKKKGKE